jgi:hypothetical protein
MDLLDAIIPERTFVGKISARVKDDLKSAMVQQWASYYQAQTLKTISLNA